ncbi:MAG: ATP-binding protein, partial [bacterium]|nr:ATP-binding protein [bacterium]
IDGDAVIDHNIYVGGRNHPSAPGIGTRIERRTRGAGLTAELLTALCAGESRCVVRDATGAAAHHAFASWSLVPGPRSGNSKVWRVTQSLGFGEAEAPTGAADRKAPPSEAAPCDILVIDEAGLGFRNRPETWTPHLTDGDPRWIVLKMSHPACCGSLWTRLLDPGYLDRLIVIISADDLRRSGAAISQGLSWEQSVQDLLGDLAYHAELRGLAAARHVVVNFGDDGALWVDNSDRALPRRRLIFDPGHLEGNWREGIEGNVPGSGSCLPAALAWALCGDGNSDVDLAAAIARGVAARRALLEAGHGTGDSGGPDFPFASVVAVLQGPRGGGLRTVTVPDFAVPGPPGSTTKDGADWSIIVGDPVDGYRPLMGRAREVALRGEAALSGIPYGRFGKLYTVDRIELNGFYSIRKLISDYVGEENPGKPLSLGVFGPPGSGKSFGIKQITQGILGRGATILTFNLSQFTGPEMLAGALHQVRDEVLRGHVPVVFWDEFDSRELMWLQYMLAPMNDGEFLEGQVTHPVGKCIFIFAGGTCDSFEAFCARAPGTESGLRRRQGSGFHQPAQGLPQRSWPQPQDRRRQARRDRCGVPDPAGHHAACAGGVRRLQSPAHRSRVAERDAEDRRVQARRAVDGDDRQSDHRRREAGMVAVQPAPS